MAEREETYEFAAPILRLDTGLRQHYVPIPSDIADELVDHGVRRVLASFNGREISRGVQGRKDGERRLLIGIPFMKELGLRFGDTVHLVLKPDPKPDRIELGKEFEEVLRQDEAARCRFESFPPSKRRGLAYYVNSAKRVETRVRRALEVAHKIRTHTLYGDEGRMR